MEALIHPRLGVTEFGGLLSESERQNVKLDALRKRRPANTEKPQVEMWNMNQYPGLDQVSSVFHVKECRTLKLTFEAQHPVALISSSSFATKWEMKLKILPACYSLSCALVWKESQWCIDTCVVVFECFIMLQHGCISVNCTCAAPNLFADAVIVFTAWGTWSRY